MLEIFNANMYNGLDEFHRPAYYYEIFLFSQFSTEILTGYPALDQHFLVDDSYTRATE